MVFENLLNPVFFPLLNLPTLWAVILLSFLISFVITLLYKYTTNQNLMKQLKDEMKEFQKEIKELRKEPEKAMQVQKKAMQTNMKYMTQSMKSTLYSFIPIIIIFSWMTAHLAYDPILPGQDFTTTVTFEKSANGMIELSVPNGVTINGDAKKEIKDLTPDDPRIEKYATLLKALCKKARVTTRQTTASLPVSYIFHAVLTMPKIESKEIKLKGRTVGKKIKLAFLKIGLKLAGVFSVS